MKWLVERYVFDERDLQFKFAEAFEVSSDEDLLRIVKEVIAPAPRTERWNITVVRDEIVVTKNK